MKEHTRNMCTMCFRRPAVKRVPATKDNLCTDCVQLAMDASTKAKGVKTPRNQPCPCGSGKKYKKCCLIKRRPTIHRMG